MRALASRRRVVSLPTTKSEPAERSSPSGDVSNGRSQLVGEFQRTRILSAMVEEVSSGGYNSASVARIIRRAGVSRRTFYELFPDRESCLLACFEDALSRACPAVTAAYTSEAPWADRARAALWAILAFLDEEPQLARLCVVEMLAAGPPALARRRRLLDLLALGVDEAGGPPRRRPTLVAEGVVGGVLAMIHARVLQQAPEPLLALSNQLMAMIVLPFLGPKRARGELERRSPRPLPPRGRPAEVPSRHAVTNMRLTYRTVRTLSAIAAAPGSSNSDVARAAGIGDPGQTSKLLTRLRGLGLVRNESAPRGRGEPNAWSLTDDGRQLLRALAHESRGLPE
jgi:AcrR family transcriptional regulator/DNA-binding MarR family transcriptional regulator